MVKNIGQLLGALTADSWCVKAIFHSNSTRQENTDSSGQLIWSCENLF